MRGLAIPRLSVRPGDFSLKQRFMAAMGVIFACALALGMTVIAIYHEAARTHRQNLARLSAFGEVMDAANLISTERGPTNSILAEDADGAAHDRLRLARLATDTALVRVAEKDGLAGAVAELRERLEMARRRFDGLAEQPHETRRPKDISEAVESMFAVYDAAQPLMDTAAAELLANDPALVGRALVVRMLSALRDQAGRLGSHLVIAIAQGGPMDPERRAAFERTRGRALELWHLSQQQVVGLRDAATSEASRAVQQQFFGEGLRLIESVIAQEIENKHRFTPASFTQAIVPHFKPIETLRDAFLSATMARLEDEQARAETAFTLAAGATALALGTVLLLFVASERLLFDPLLTARDRVLDLADGHLADPIDTRQHRGEVRNLLEALVALRAKLIERESLDAERLRLTAQLKRQAETDGLTGTLNRGALERLAGKLLNGETDTSLDLVLLDIDRFKAINDRYGHAAGDEVLREAARRLRHALRQDDIVARFGGEEFAVLLFGRRTEGTADVAERLRRALADTPVTLADGAPVAISASFGTARAAPGTQWRPLVAAADRALYEAKKRGRNQVVAADEMV